MNFKHLIICCVFIIYATSCDKEENAAISPTAAFTFTKLSRNEISFLNNSTNATSFNWDFGDGKTSMETNPTHLYAGSGKFTVTLEAINDTSSDFQEVEIEIEEVKVQVSTLTELMDPVALAVDKTGNIYVADPQNDMIRKVTKNGIVSTFVDSGLDGPTGIALDNSGSIYVTQTNESILKISGDGQISLLAGGTSGNEDGVGSEAQFRSPMGVVVDNSNDIYVVDRLNHRIRKITQEGVVSTIAGSTLGYEDGLGIEAKFNSPVGIAIDKDGSLYIGDANNAVIRKITTEGVVSTYSGSHWGFKDGTDGLFKNPLGLEVDSYGNVYVADNSNHKIRKISTDGIISTLAGSDKGFKDGDGKEAQFNVPFDIAIDNLGNVYIADYDNSRIRVISEL